MRAEGRAKMADVPEVEVGSLRDIGNVKSEGRSPVKDDTQTPNMRGGKKEGVVKRDDKIFHFTKSRLLQVEVLFYC